MAGAGRFQGRMRRLLVAGTLVPVIAGLAACGGDEEPTAAERKAAKNQWLQRVDGACRKANDAIAGRGWPANLVDLDRLVVRGIDDTRSAIRSIGGLRIPEGAGPRPAAFVKDLKALDPELTKLSDASEGLAPRELVKVAEALKPRLVEVEKSAKAAGLSDCLTHGERFFVPDGVRAPVFAEQLARLDRRLLRRIRSIDGGASTPAEFAAVFKQLSGAVDTAITAIDRLDPPQWASNQTANYQVALRELQSVCQEFAAILLADRNKPPEAIDLARYRRLEREVQRAGRAELKARRKMLRAVGAEPTFRIPPGDDGGGAEPASGDPA